MGNMTVEDILDELGGYGTVTLRKIKYPISASRSGPDKFMKESWDLELTLPGYLGKNITAYVRVTGSNIREVTEKAYDQLEAYIFSEEAKEDRARYEEQHNFYQDRYDKASADQRMGHNPIRPPERFKPPIVWGQPRSWETIDETRDAETDTKASKGSLGRSGRSRRRRLL